MIYFITDGRYTKVGYSKNPSERIKSLSSPFEHGKPIAIVGLYNGGYGCEYNMHRHYLSRHIYNEWYDLEGVDKDNDYHTINGEVEEPPSNWQNMHKHIFEFKPTTPLPTAEIAKRIKWDVQQVNSIFLINDYKNNEMWKNRYPLLMENIIISPVI